MATVIYPSPIFGPVHSRRLGVSLGINLLPEDGKWCTFDCVYCECGFNKDFRPKKPLPTREEVRTALEERLKGMSSNGPVPDVLTFAGNVDNNILKLDTVDEGYIRRVDRPTGRYEISRVVERLKDFRGKVIIQTMFMKGMSEGADVDNTSDRFVEPWLRAVKEISPSQVMIYTIDRETPDHELKKATREELDRIAGRIRQEGLEVSVSY